jgi:hypothetical protein
VYADSRYLLEVIEAGIFATDPTDELGWLGVICVIRAIRGQKV